MMSDGLWEPALMDGLCILCFEDVTLSQKIGFLDRAFSAVVRWLLMFKGWFD